MDFRLLLYLVSVLTSACRGVLLIPVEIVDKETLIIKTIPYNITTSNLIDSIIRANNSGKIKVKNIQDNTAENVEIVIKIVKGVSPNLTIDALYAFTNCEISLSPNCCVIINNKPAFVSTNELLRNSTDYTLLTLKKELEYSLETYYASQLFTRDALGQRMEWFPTL